MPLEKEYLGRMAPLFRQFFQTIIDISLRACAQLPVVAAVLALAL
jgi:hypothetical protein